MCEKEVKKKGIGRGRNIPVVYALSGSGRKRNERRSDEACCFGTTRKGNCSIANPMGEKKRDGELLKGLPLDTAVRKKKKVEKRIADSSSKALSLQGEKGNKNIARVEIVKRKFDRGEKKRERRRKKVCLAHLNFSIREEKGKKKGDRHDDRAPRFPIVSPFWERSSGRKQKRSGILFDKRRRLEKRTIVAQEPCSHSSTTRD